MDALTDYLLSKESEVSGTNTMPNSPSAKPNERHCPTKTIKKAGVRVDVTNMNAPKTASVNSAELYAMPSIQRYPLDSYANVKQAAAYFDENYKLMAPAHRREYCVNLVKRASQLGIGISKTAEKYGADGYASVGEMEAAFISRSNNLLEDSQKHLLSELREKQATMDPDGFAALLGEFDKATGLDAFYGNESVLDPYFSTFGKTAASKSYVMGNEFLSADDLKEFSLTNADLMSVTYPQEVIDEFRKDPTGVFESLPKPQQKALARLINQTITGTTPT